jgi:hypothetical protein
MRLSLEQRTVALLALVEDYRARRCAALFEPAREQAREILRAARAQGRRRVRATVGELRQRLAAEVGAAQARAATERRVTEQRRALVLLNDAWRELRAALQQRWHDPAARRLWIDTQLQRALRVLARRRHNTANTDVGEPWSIDYAADWPETERQECFGRIAAAGIVIAATQARDDVDGGIRIRAGANVVDATIDGLLADRAAVEGRLLDLLRAVQPAVAPLAAAAE